MFRTKSVRRVVVALVLVAAAAFGVQSSGSAHHEAGIRWQAMHQNAQ